MDIYNVLKRKKKVGEHEQPPIDEKEKRKKSYMYDIFRHMYDM